MRRDPQRLQDMLDALEWIAQAVSGLTEEKFLASEVFRYAIARQLTVVGEAAAGLTPELTRRYPLTPWPDIVGLCSSLVHEYFGIYWVSVWKTAFHAPVLRVQIAEILAAEESG